MWRGDDKSRGVSGEKVDNASQAGGEARDIASRASICGLLPLFLEQGLLAPKVHSRLITILWNIEA